MIKAIKQLLDAIEAFNTGLAATIKYWWLSVCLKQYKYNCEALNDDQRRLMHVAAERNKFIKQFKVWE